LLDKKYRCSASAVFFQLQLPGKVDELPLPAGQAVGFVQDIRAVREIIIEMVDEVRAVLNSLHENK
jgi:NAD(P)H-dependent flavin oxidoreductase YrpB (nitropropane dioxygenase family)